MWGITEIRHWKYQGILETQSAFAPSEASTSEIIVPQNNMTFV